MKFNYFLVFLQSVLFSCSTILGQETSNPINIQQRITNLSEEEKLSNMLGLADQLVQAYPDSSLFISAQVLKLADSIRNTELAARAHYTIGMASYFKKQFEEACQEFSKSLEYAKRKGDHEFSVKIMIGLAEIKYEKLQYDSAKIMLEAAKAIAVKHNYEAPLSNIYNNLAKISGNQGNRTEAIEGYLKAAELFMEQNRHDALAVVYNNIGILYNNLENPEDAIQYFNKAVEICKKENITTDIYNYYNSLGNIYSESDTLDKAIYYYTLVLEDARKSGDEYNLAKCFLNIANLHKKMGEYVNAKKYYDSSIYLSEKNNIVFGIIIGKMNLGKFYNQTGNYQQSLKTLREAQKLLSGYKLPEADARLSAWMSEAFKQTGVYDSALYYFEKYEHINDSISGQKTKDKVLELEKKYQSERKAREIAELQKNVSEEKSRNKIFIIALVFVVVLSLFTGLLLIFRRRAAILKEKLTLQENMELKNTMELRNQELVSKALMVSNLNEHLGKINHLILQIKPSLNAEAVEKLEILVRDLEVSLPDQAWREFETRFDQVHQGFFNRLTAQFPELSPTELKISSLLRLNMSTKDIALLTNRSIGTVDNIRSSIRKKLKLDAEANLTCFLLSF
ncbi:MAG: tetratricopeptide repeat protein [Bacteroidales bacterium]|nr:tetratricopeptide repeat protein [Bacteroidales bacterium]